jgi:hypothetical protein
MISVPSTNSTVSPTKPLRSRRQCPVPEFTVEVPELDDAAIEAIAQLLVGMLDDERTPGGEWPPGNL